MTGRRKGRFESTASQIRGLSIYFHLRNKSYQASQIPIHIPSSKMNLPSLISLFGLSAAASIPQTDTTPQNGIRWINCAENVPQSDDTFNASSIDLSSLPLRLECGQLDVPMDYSKPFCEDTNMITLGLAVVRAEKSKGALFL